MGTPLHDPPRCAAWLHRQARAGFEVAFFRADAEGHVLDGSTSAVEDGEAWNVSYSLTIGPAGATRGARVTSRSVGGPRERVLVADGAGRWWVDGEAAPRLDGCLDVDLESSACTNALTVRRLRLPVGGRAAAPAAYVRAPGLGVDRLEQDYVRVADDDLGHQRYDYAAPGLAFACRLVCDRSGLVLEYPGIASRVAVGAPA
ncbi:putative glycolipid-binding domain-containing protein [Georgenia sp. SYP-B2076]|uniref:putative glycolipid-binding domain-containing protein n=1 Tax=Georgenia sp. SYP-B2076 TaxID=2495881 RepID=UPI000F8CF091|nr:putative glycolipid-binding domain-containing protein [Georgenia sp. SYP-B2076]